VIPYLLQLRSSSARLPSSMRRRHRDTVLAGTYEHHCLYVLAKTVQRGDLSNIRLSQVGILDWSTCHDWARSTSYKI